MTKSTSFGRVLRPDFYLEDGYVPLNHGSFGACPQSIYTTYRHYQEESEKHPDRFLKREVFKDLEKNRDSLAELVQCNSQEVAFVVNASYGINSVLRSGFLKPGDKVLCVSLLFSLPLLSNQFSHAMGLKILYVTGRTNSFLYY